MRGRRRDRTTACRRSPQERVARPTAWRGATPRRAPPRRDRVPPATLHLGLAPARGVGGAAPRGRRGCGALARRMTSRRGLPATLAPSRVQVQRAFRPSCGAACSLLRASSAPLVTRAVRRLHDAHAGARNTRGDASEAKKRALRRLGRGSAGRRRCILRSPVLRASRGVSQIRSPRRSSLSPLPREISVNRVAPRVDLMCGANASVFSRASGAIPRLPGNPTRTQ